MKLFLAVVLVLISRGVFMANSNPVAEQKPLRTVDFVDLQRYLGKWYEIARYANRFQKNCFAATAFYSLRPDGDITVVNECRKGSVAGKQSRVRGKAWVVDKASFAKLKVQFFWPFSGDYWIIQLGENYEYAVVGEPRRRYLWILYRRSIMPDPLYREIRQRLQSQGYDPSMLLKTIHSQKAEPAGNASPGSGE